MKIFIVLILVAITTSSLAMDKCSVVKTLRNLGLGGYKGHPLEDYVCLAWYASNYITSWNRSPSEFGIFQINSYWWCDDGHTSGRKNLCGVSCKYFLDSYLADDVACLKKIVSGQGLGAWDAWKVNCKGRDNTRFINGC